jgi:hypothetical protein
MRHVTVFSTNNNNNDHDANNSDSRPVGAEVDLGEGTSETAHFWAIQVCLYFPLLFLILF